MRQIFNFIENNSELCNNRILIHLSDYLDSVKPFSFNGELHTKDGLLKAIKGKKVIVVSLGASGNAVYCPIEYIENDTNLRELYDNLSDIVNKRNF